MKLSSLEQKKAKKYKYREWKSGILFVLPAVILLLIFNTLPLGMAFVRSFQDYNTKEFIFFQNYQAVLADSVFRKSFVNVIILGGCCLVLTMVLSFFFAKLLIRLPQRLSGIIKVLIYIPCILSSVVVSVIVCLLTNYGGGLFTSMLISSGHEAIAFSKEGIWPYAMIIIPIVWGGFGYNTLIMMAGLLDIPKFFYEAADIEGASSFKKLIMITIPSMKNYFVLMIVNLVTGYLQMLDIPYLITGGGPDNQTITPALYLFSNFKDSNSTPNVTIAGAVLILIIIVVLNSIIFFTIKSKKTEID